MSSSRTATEEEDYEEDFEDEFPIIRLPEGESGPASDFERETELEAEWTAPQEETPAEKNTKKKKRNNKKQKKKEKQ